MIGFALGVVVGFLSALLVGAIGLLTERRRDHHDPCQCEACWRERERRSS